MNLKELNFPVRVYWDLTPLPPYSDIDYLMICEEILGLKVLILNLRDVGGLSSNACINILKRLKGENIAVSLAMPFSDINSSTATLLRNMNIGMLFIETSSHRELTLQVDNIKQVINAALPVGISFNVTENNYKNIPDVLRFCLDNGISNLAFPMQRLAPGTECFFLDRDKREKVGLDLKGIDYKDIKSVIIHDPFLWRVFYPSVRFPEGGCQAANSMIYISPHGDVYPCPSMPLNLGRILKGGLKEILSSTQKKELRKSIANPPERCSSCTELNECMGGCRGRAYFIAQSFSKCDPACKHDF